MKATDAISVAQWQAMSLKQKSKIIDELWQIPHAAESLGKAWPIVKLLTSWGYTVEWVHGVNEKGERCGGHWCDIRPGLAPKVDLQIGIGYGSTLSESLCAAALRSVQLLAMR